MYSLQVNWAFYCADSTPTAASWPQQRLLGNASEIYLMLLDTWVMWPHLIYKHDSRNTITVCRLTSEWYGVLLRQFLLGDLFDTYLIHLYVSYKFSLFHCLSLFDIRFYLIFIIRVFILAWTVTYLFTRSLILWGKYQKINSSYRWLVK